MRAFSLRCALRHRSTVPRATYSAHRVPYVRTFALSTPARNDAIMIADGGKMRRQPGPTPAQLSAALPSVPICIWCGKPKPELAGEPLNACEDCAEALGRDMETHTADERRREMRVSPRNSV